MAACCLVGTRSSHPNSVPIHSSPGGRSCPNFQYCQHHRLHQMSERYCVVLFQLIAFMFHVGTIFKVLFDNLEMAIFLALELSYNSTRDLIGSWLFCMQNSPCWVSFLYILGVSVEVWIWFIGGHTNFRAFGMPKWVWPPRPSETPSMHQKLMEHG
jgi:hypothetical protein